MADSELESLTLAAEVAREEAAQALGARLTPGNFEELLTAYVPRLYGWGIGRIALPDGIDDFDDDEIESQYMVRVEVTGSEDAPRVIESLVRRIYPYVHHLDSADDEDSYEGRCVSCEFLIITKEADRAKELDPPIVEHTIRTFRGFLAYALRNNVMLSGPLVQRLSLKEGSARELFEICEESYATWVANQKRRRKPLSSDEFTCRVSYLWRLPNIRVACANHYVAWESDYYRSLWCNLHGRLLSLGLALAPMLLAPYELLWILDYISPMSFRYYRDGAPYDQNHRRKLRLFENVAQSYSRIKSGK
jgi:hypothetical protein